MTEQLQKSMQRMDELIRDLKHVNSISPKGMDKGLQRMVLMEKRRQICFEMEEVNEVIKTEVQKG